VSYVELTARTHFSFLRGASSPKALLHRAAELEYEALGVTDCDGLYGIVRALEAAEEMGVRLIVGSEVAIDAPDVAGARAATGSIWLHVATLEGYRNLCRILTESHKRHPKGKARRPDEGVARNQFAGIPLDEVCAHAAGLWCEVPPSGVDAGPLREAFGDRLSALAWQHLDGEDEGRLERVEALASSFDTPVCASNRVLYATRAEKPILDVLHCIREGVALDDAGRSLSPNTEAHLKSRLEMSRLFASRPAWLDRSREVADACRFSMRELKYHFPSEFPDNPGGPAPAARRRRAKIEGETPDATLRRLTFEGARDRYPRGLPDSVRAQIEKELELVRQIEVAPYFLSVQAIVEMARDRDILCQGRGSAANSAVCYCLGVTSVDPSRSNLLFERFLSAERREPPDIDVDFEHERREEVIQAIYSTFGRDRAAMVSEIISYRGKSALREVGKAFGLSLEQVDRLGALVSWWDKLDEIDADRVRACGFDPKDVRVRQVLAMAHALQGCPRHLSIHVGGFVLSAEPLDHVAPVEPATMRERTVIPWDKDDLDTLGFFKVDVLGLGMLTAIRKALDLAWPRIQRLEREDGKPGALDLDGESFPSSSCPVSSLSRAQSAIDRLAAIPAEDPRVYDALCAADTVGVFQIESRAQMAMLPRLRPREFYDLVVEVAIVRPGPIQGGMVHPYLRRRMGLEPANVPHAKLAPILARTLGVPLFQEQVMQLAIAGAGYTGGEADQLRRDMAAWRRNGKLERHRARLLEGFRKNGIDREFGERLYQSIEGFGEYGFPESHAASFALLVYASAWLKVHHPAAFAAALINSQPMGFYSPGSIVKDAERHDVEVLPARVDTSDWDCTLEGVDPKLAGDPPALRLGLRLVDGLGEDAGRRVERARCVRAFAGVEDLVARAGLQRRELDALARAGALASFGLGRREAIWKTRAPREDDLLAGLDFREEMPPLPPMTRVEQMVLDYSTTGITVGDHAMSVVRGTLPPHFKNARDLASMAHGESVSTAGLVICRQRPQTASGVVFITMEDETGFVNLILWNRTFDRWRHVATTSSLLAAHGKVERDGDVVYVVPERLEALGLSDGKDLPSASRDFR
jgi:error-prone DNA polymerase